MSWRKQWWTKEEVMKECGISESTFYRWRRRHSIAVSRLTRRHPLVFNANDVIEAEILENPNWRDAENDVTIGTCYAGASARNDTHGRVS